MLTFEWHYDCAVPLSDKGVKKSLGYDLSNRRPGPGSVKHEYVQEEEDIDPRVRQYFLETVMKNKAAGSLWRGNRKDALVLLPPVPRMGDENRARQEVDGQPAHH